jgi:hypothetical protein
MRRLTTISLLLVLFCAPAFSNDVIDHISYGKFGKITVYHPENTPTSVVLFVSGDGGWKDAVVVMAKDMAAEGALVLGIDARHYGYYLSKVSAACLYPAADFEELSLSVQKKYKLVNYHKPVLVGYSYGAVLVYGSLVQAPPDTFRGAIAKELYPELKIKMPASVPKGLLYLIAWLMEINGKIKGQAPLLSVTDLSMFSGLQQNFDISKARTELGFNPKPPRQIVVESLQYLIDNKTLFL